MWTEDWRLLVHILYVQSSEQSLVVDIYHGYKAQLAKLCFEF